MRDGQRHEFRFAEGKRRAYFVRHGVDVAGKTILSIERKSEHALEHADGFLRAIHRHLASAVAKRPHIVEPHDVIRVRMREHHRVHATDAFAQRLKAKVRPGIHDERALGRLDVKRRPCAFVARV